MFLIDPKEKNMQHQYALSAPVSGFNSPASSRHVSRPPSPPHLPPPPPPPPQQPQEPKQDILPWLIGGGIALPIVYYGSRWLLKKPSVQAMIARKFNKGNRLIEDTYAHKPSRTPFPKGKPTGVREHHNVHHG